MMAKKANKRDGSKSAAVADFMKKNPKLTAKQIHEGLTRQGVKVSLATVNKVKYSKPKRKQTLRKAGAAPATVQSSGISVEGLLHVKGLVDSLGGIKQTKEVLELLDRLS
jgi:hypothetical protein